MQNKKIKVRIIAIIIACACSIVSVASFYQAEQKRKTPLNTGVSYSDVTNFDKIIPFKIEGDKWLEITVLAHVKEGDINFSITNPKNIEILNENGPEINKKIKVKAIKGQWKYRTISKKSINGEYHITCKLKDN